MIRPLRSALVNRVILRLVLVVCALTWWGLPGFGGIDLGVTWSSAWPVMLEAGWGLLMTVGLGLPFLATAIRPSVGRAALVQVYVVAAALLVGAVLGLEPQAWWIFVLLAIELPPLILAARGDIGDPLPSRALTILTIVAVLPALAYAWHMCAQNRLGLASGDITLGTDHYSVQAAVALSLVGLPAVASYWPATRRLLGTSTAVMAGYLGLVSVGWPDAVAGFSPAWSVAVLVWAVAIAVASWWPTVRRIPVKAL